MVHVVMRVSGCLLCLVLLFFVEIPLSALGASQQVCLPTVQGPITTPPEQAGTVLINEMVLAAKQPASCPGATTVPDATNTSWLELYNPMALSFNLYIAHAAIDGGSGTTAMRFPFGSAIAAHGFLTIFLDKSIIFTNGAPETFTRRLLFNGTVIDQITIPSNLGIDQSYARVPDGASTWVITNTSTIGRSNVLPTPTPKPIHTPKPVAAKKKSNGGKISGRIRSTPGKTLTTNPGITTTTQSSHPGVVNGVQPPWHQLQLPGPSSASQSASSAAAPATTAPVDTTANAPPANNDSADIPRKLLFTGLAIACAGALFWCWRRFMHS